MVPGDQLLVTITYLNEAGVDVRGQWIVVELRQFDAVDTVSYTHLTLPTIYSV